MKFPPPPARPRLHLRALSCPAACSSTSAGTLSGLTVPRRVLQHFCGHVIGPHRAPPRARRFLDSGCASARNDKGTLNAPGVPSTAPPDALSRPFRSRCPHPSTTRRTSPLSFRPSASERRNLLHASTTRHSRPDRESLPSHFDLVLPPVISIEQRSLVISTERQRAEKSIARSFQKKRPPNAREA